MKKVVFTVLVLGLFAACQSVEKTEKPENLIPEDKMIEVLTDLAKLDASRSYNETSFSKRDVKIKKLIYAKYGIDSTQFAKSSNYYAEDFNVNQRLYDSVRVRLERDKARVDALIKKEDSLKNAKKQAIIKKSEKLSKKENN
ncbi:DUF4296 domain-containing protein [Haloflavibacter putidus]|uniref:DUF4296 domain-containing protein n=1 Tax=Haloflavibacter putidus TaxID=2576776 RepID=A0A507ZNK0_9FLAO|nr:DUF4296 domain-containing protein [Haloflavibacter putidus]TQD38567.1 DUF4296 domain-containing protein [Haloflavibacter putidus]